MISSFCIYYDKKNAPDGSDTNVFRRYKGLYADGSR